MADGADREPMLAAFLLGALPEAEHDTVEARLFVDDELRDRLDLARDDLIHAYLADRLAAKERDAFEEHFLLSARHRERLELVRDLITATGRVAAGTRRRRRAGPDKRVIAWPAAAAVLLALGAVVAAFVARPAGRDLRLGEVSPPPSATPTATSSASVPPSPASPPPGERRAVEVVRMASRPAEVTEVPVRPDTATVRLLVPVAPAPSYDVVLTDVNGSEAWRAEGLTLRAAGEPLVVSVPVDVLAQGDYALAVQGEALRAASPPALVRRLRVVRASR